MLVLYLTKVDLKKANSIGNVNVILKTETNRFDIFLLYLLWSFKLDNLKYGYVNDLIIDFKPTMLLKWEYEWEYSSETQTICVWRRQGLKELSSKLRVNVLSMKTRVQPEDCFSIPWWWSRENIVNVFVDIIQGFKTWFKTTGGMVISGKNLSSESCDSTGGQCKHECWTRSSRVDIIKVRQ